MELRQLRHFLAVAEELHFGRAARRLRMAQPPLSQSIMRLEESLGTQLFQRSSREVQLTAAGTALLAQAREIVQRADEAEREVKLTASAPRMLVRVGFVPLSTSPALLQAVREYRKRRPHIDVELHELASATQLRRLRRGALDIGLTVGHESDVSGLTSALLTRFGPVIATPERWPLAKRRVAHVSDLKGLPLMLFPQQFEAPYFAELSSACRRSGFTPTVAQRVTQPYTMLSLVALELGIAVVPASARHPAVAGVAFVPLAGLPHSFDTQVVMAWPQRKAASHVAEFVALIRSLDEVAARAVGSITG